MSKCSAAGDCATAGKCCFEDGLRRVAFVHTRDWSRGEGNNVSAAEMVRLSGLEEGGMLLILYRAAVEGTVPRVQYILCGL